ncbi:hypothetical protein Tco_1372670 [Tanacetum coccineum]
MHVMVAMVIRMQGDKAGIKRLMKEMEMMTTIRLFSVFHELSQLQEKQMFSVITVMKKATMLMIVKNQEFMMKTDGNAETVPSYDAKVVSEVNASSKVHGQMRHEKRKTIIQTYDDDQIDSNIIFDDPYVENNGGMSDHDSNNHDEYHKIQILAYDVQREAENQKRLNNRVRIESNCWSKKHFNVQNIKKHVKSWNVN